MKRNWDPYRCVGTHVRALSARDDLRRIMVPNSSQINTTDQTLTTYSSSLDISVVNGNWNTNDEPLVGFKHVHI